MARCALYGNISLFRVARLFFSFSLFFIWNGQEFIAAVVSPYPPLSLC